MNSYKEACDELSKLVEEIEDDHIQLDTLADKVKEARKLIAFCETKLRSIDDEVKALLTDDKAC